MLLWWGSYKLRNRAAEGRSPKLDLANGRGGELLHHREQQLAVAVVQVRGIAPNLCQEPKLIVRELVCIQFPPESILGEKL